MAERTDYLVLLPTTSEGIDYGYLAPMRVLATTYEDAIKVACERWFGRAIPDEGVAIAVPSEHALAFVIGELKSVQIVHGTSLPDSLAGKSGV